MSLNDELANLFATFAAIMEIKGENQFKAIAFSKVGRILKDMALDVKKLCEEGKIDQIEGIGKSSCAIIKEYVATGHSVDFEEVAASVPPGLIPMLEIPGLGPKTISLLWKQRGITGLEELVKALDTGSLAGLKGIGEKKIESIKQGIALRAQASGAWESWMRCRSPKQCSNNCAGRRGFRRPKSPAACAAGGKRSAIWI